eukprot:4264428-Lingulodinium_polyedra.AAC.1
MRACRVNVSELRARLSSSTVIQVVRNAGLDVPGSRGARRVHKTLRSPDGDARTCHAPFARNRARATNCRLADATRQSAWPLATATQRQDP